MMRSGNPALNAKTFAGFDATSDAVMTVQGTVNKTAILLAFVVASAIYVWRLFFATGDAATIMPYVLAGGIGGLIFAMIAIFKPTTASWSAPIYAVLEGLVLGGVSALFENAYPGIVMQAVGLTFGTMFALLFAYKSGIIRATENFKLGVFAATGGIFMLYMVNIVMGFFGSGMDFIHNSGLWGIAFSGFVVVIAALNLVLDFDFIEDAAAKGAPKYMEWRAALGLLITLVWLYFEILRLLSKLRSRN